MDITIRDIDVTTVIAVSAVLVVLPIQLLLCFKVKKLLLRLLPTMLLAVTTVVFFAMMATAKDWDAIGYAILGVFSGVLLIFSGIGWGVWAVALFIRKKKQGAFQDSISPADE